MARTTTTATTTGNGGAPAAKTGERPLAGGADRPEADGNLVLDELGERLDAFRRLRKDDPAGADAVLDDFGAHGKAEQDIVFELSAHRPLYLPDRFEEAHRLLMRSLEVLDRNGARAPKLPPVGPLQPVASFGVQLVTRFIVRSYQSSVINAVKNLYVRRESQCAPLVPERAMLRRARIDAERVAPTMKKSPLGLPTFLAGGAALSGGLSWVGRAAATASSGKVPLVIATVLLALVALGVSWVVLRGAGVARKRIRLTVDRPVKALYETIGACGKPPRDQSRQFALVAVLLTGVGVLVVVAGAIAAVFA